MSSARGWASFPPSEAPMLALCRATASQMAVSNTADGTCSNVGGTCS